MSIIKNTSPRFAAVPSVTLRDPELPGDVLGLLAFLLDFPPDWDVSVKWIVAQKRFGSNGKVVEALKTLRALGYARLRKHRDGTSEWDITSLKGCFEIPMTEPNSQNRNMGTSPDSENRNKAEECHIPVSATCENPNYGFRNATTEGIPTDSEEPTKEESPPTPLTGGRKGKKPSAAEDPCFAEFYAAYPRKAARVDAVKAWGKLKVDEPLFAAIMAGLEVAKRSPDWVKDGGAFIPYPASWLNGRRWEDEIKPGAAAGPNGSISRRRVVN